MKIALLNLPLDSNYGGNLQRLALVMVLKKYGHDVVHLNLHYIPHVSVLKKYRWYLKQILKKIVISNTIIKWDDNVRKFDEIRCRVAQPFYDEKIPHTLPIYNLDDLKSYTSFDAYIVGSDQVWRPSMTKSYGLSTYFFDFLPEESTAKRIAYAVSMGTSENELGISQITALRKHYEKFSCVSVRESDALHLLDAYGWTNPQAELVLDPTLLLERSDYESIIEENETMPDNGNIFCYILDMTPFKRAEIEAFSEKVGGETFFQIGCSSVEDMSIAQWLRSFRDADYVVTDSYHGFIFSLIFNKPVKVLFNELRGNSRFTSLSKFLNIDFDVDNWNWCFINRQIQKQREKSLKFLTSYLR